MGEDGADLERAQSSHRQLHFGRRSADAGVAGESGSARAASVAGAGGGHYTPDRDGVRSRPRAAGKYCAMLPGGVVASRDFRTLRAAEFSQDFRVEGAADLYSAQYASDV